MTIRLEYMEVSGWTAAIRGMRNPLESWAKSDTLFGGHMGPARLGPEDLKLACKLVKQGGSHRKFMRMINVHMDIVAPRYWWTEFDTYKVGTVRDSCSTMFKLGTRPLAPEDFADGYVLPSLLCELNRIGEQMRSGNRSKELVRDMKKNLPEGFLQRATVMFNYECALHMLHDRMTHRLPEWGGPQGFCKTILNELPHLNDFYTASSDPS